ncbi:asparaginyl/glutamyl-tRNA amidotransferase subunit C [candidate division WOR-1 bacterium RIFOXYA2_FULL_36_21]|uniref:Aspartyl/glutamyl-tRNA(Asn/Gln) amidotransferase subunit C n=1 Tax=candidate division WOR-1 bacterium RIFOXYB2_FULL_36_35 TaxID=1802578 RepID=A0A1F4S0P7_UNCSA|nr:MAG: asparaginyl/glutamyl-tRNA amidotransferase subunit C [candidate division WOR-1 bacterium RIFOXYA2_FULL_36_21]OGC13980.1 MAG: asparaginyl/glutamyl-tRNA amidotransferase subunit C [candidate division WOR-1 bacterium RIFOXYB2_FULL_36_35]OGC16603.1 MAG: asparaginyl/glutamyl-tRNA amidotransferase subunit C [candidate division WOR-1 bacterium RIFOXYA12_FULL_36_13]
MRYNLNMDINIDHIAHLARLGLSEEEKMTFSKQLDNILQYAKNLNKLDTKDIPPTSHAIPISNVMREDVVKKYKDIDVILKNGPEIEENMFRVPKIME